MSIYKKLFEIRHEIEGVQKDAKNPYFKSDYVTLNGLLDALNPLLKKHNVLMLQPTESSGKEEHISVRTRFICLDSEDTENHLQFLTELPLTKNDPQAAGSAITYARRYALMSFFSIKAEDDDGNSATFEDKANTYQLNEIKSLAKELDLEEKVAETIGQWSYKTIEELPKDRAQTVLDRLRQVKKERTENANVQE